ncbi:serine protease [Micractinium conductrix]|uniref:Serine protease n=1 Tax=Micractinium conductrix TaxID=554055 RepID=A0A2P6V484_9CHLO|nr:serine protease [Micractinium conductrix]|eukprot:PSC68903.1 serine protease [Micractinium conductrix]
MRRAPAGACRLLALAACVAVAASVPKHPPLPADIYPFITLVANKELPLCTGALVAPRAVLTAASCAKAKPSFAFVGAHNFFLDSFRREGKYEIQKVERVEVHPDFDSSDLNQHNLALLVLKRSVVGHHPVSLAGANFTHPVKSAAVRALGFGSLSADGFFPQLHADELTLLPEEECGGLQTAYGRWWAATPANAAAGHEACTGLSHAFRACAAGNVGAPLLLPRGAPDGGPLQLGLLTSGFACSTDPAVASASSPALYTWLPRYTEWIGKQLRQVAEEDAEARKKWAAGRQ